MLRRAARCTRLPFWEMRIFGGIPPPPWSIGIIGLAGKWWFDLWGSTTYGQNLEGQGVRWDWWLGLTGGLDFFWGSVGASCFTRLTRKMGDAAGSQLYSPHQSPSGRGPWNRILPPKARQGWSTRQNGDIVHVHLPRADFNPLNDCRPRHQAIVFAFAIFTLKGTIMRQQSLRIACFALITIALAFTAKAWAGDKETVLFNFQGGTYGSFPGSFVRDADGNFYRLRGQFGL